MLAGFLFFKKNMSDGENMSDVRVRFAPSPTGKLHIGGARTAIYNWAFARATGGKFILRIEDTDPERSTQENVDLILRAMRWLGLDWDEGPQVDGDFGPYFQTQRMDSYKQALDKLIECGAAYPCFCSADENAARRDAIQSQGHIIYDKCRSLDKDEAKARIEAGEPHVWRLAVPKDRGMITVHDLVHGDVEFDAALQDDMIIVRSDGTPTYNFAVVCDDVNMKMTHIIRGDDHFSNTPRQILVYEALGYPTPTFVHIPMICGPDGKKLSKRHGAASVEEYAEMGYLPDALFNYLSLLGWAPDGETTIFSRDEMTRLFSLDHLSKNPSSLDPKKLDWINNQYIRKMGTEAFASAVEPLFSDAGFDVTGQHERIREMYPLVFERINLLNEAVPMLAYFFVDELELDEASVKKNLLKEGAGAKSVLEAAIAALKNCEWTLDSITTALQELPAKLDAKPRLVFQPMRIALTGNQVSPPLFESIVLFERDVVLKRFEKAKDIACN